jgi:hypothetical protein
MKRLIVAVVIPLAFVAGCSTGETPAPAPVVTVTEQAPAPTPTVNPQDEFVQGVFEEVWAGLTPSEQQDSCQAFNSFPDLFWDGFQDGLGKYKEIVTREQFDIFFSSKCIY